MVEDTFTPVSYDVRDGNVGGLGLQKYDFGQFYASKTFFDPVKQRQILWGWVAEEGGAPHAGEDWSSLRLLAFSLAIPPCRLGFFGEFPRRYWRFSFHPVGPGLDASPIRLPLISSKLARWLLRSF